MSQKTTIRKLAELVNTPVEKLLEQLSEAGMPFKDADQEVTSAQKVKLLGFLRRTHGRADAATESAGEAPKKIKNSRRFRVEAVGRKVKVKGKEMICKRGVSVAFPGDFN